MYLLSFVSYCIPIYISFKPRFLKIAKEISKVYVRSKNCFPYAPNQWPIILWFSLVKTPLQFYVLSIQNIKVRFRYGLIGKKIILHPIHIWQDLFMLRAKRAETWKPSKYCIGSTMRQTIDKEFLFDQTHVCMQ